ncbi:MAG: hypothetical protein C5B43_01135, partial [Verrucomicrobia bacterium]
MKKISAFPVGQKIQKQNTRDSNIEVSSINNTNYHSLANHFFNDIHTNIISRLIDTPDTSYIDLLNLQNTCQLFYLKVKTLILIFIKENYNADAFLSNKFLLLTCPESKFIPDCFTKYLHKTTTLLLCALLDKNTPACKAYISIFHHHTNNLLNLSQESNFQFQIMGNDSNPTDYKLSLQFVKDSTNTNNLTVNKYLFTKFLERYISSEKFTNLFLHFENKNKILIIINFLKQYQDIPQISDLIENFIEKIISSNQFEPIKIWTLHT